MHGSCITVPHEQRDNDYFVCELHHATHIEMMHGSCITVPHDDRDNTYFVCCFVQWRER